MLRLVTLIVAPSCAQGKGAMGKRLEVSDMPPLTVEMHGDVRLLERKLSKALSACCSDHELLDKHAAFEYVRTYAAEFYDCYYNFYSHLPDDKYQPHWRPASEAFAFDRVVHCIENEFPIAAYFSAHLTRVDRIKRTISDHAGRSTIPVALPATLTGKQAAALARAGIDMASASPLLLMLHEQANSQAPHAPVSINKVTVANARAALRDTYRAAFPDSGIMDICWAAKQHYREWTRWLNGELKDGSKPDRIFRQVLTSGKDAKQLRRDIRPKNWK